MESLSFEKTKKLLAEYGIPLVSTKLAFSKEEAVSLAEKTGYPLVLKISSSEVLHKSDLGLVKTGIGNRAELEKAWLEIIAAIEKKGIKKEGVLIQKELSGTEIMIGMKKDIQFGPVIVFGLGGVFVEVLKDISLRIAPVKKEDAFQMMKEIKGHKALLGFRGRKPLNLEKLAKIIVSLSNLSLAEKKIKEIDLNPIIADEKGAQVADARLLIL